MASRYYAENMSEEESSDDDAEQVTKKKVLNYEYDDFYHGNDHRVVQTEKQKKQALFNKVGSNLSKYINIHDWDKACDCLTEMLREVDKASKYIDSHGYPSSVLRAIKLLSDTINAVSAEDRKKMKNPKAFNVLRLKIKKVLPTFAKALEDFKDEESEEQSEEHRSSDESSSDQSESDIYREYLRSDDPMVRRKYWLKREVKKIEEKESSHSDSERQVTVREEKKKFHLTKEKQRQTLIVKDSEEAQERIKKILSDYAKLKSQEKGEEYLSDLDVIVKESEKYSDSQRLSILLAEIPIRMEVIKQMKYDFQNSRECWLRLFNHLKMAFDILRESEDEDLIDKIVHFDENDEQKEKVIIKATEKSIYEMIETYIMGLERDLHKSFKYLSNNEVKYSERLQDMIRFIDFMYSVSKDMSFKEGLEKCAAEIGFKVLENCYFMSADFMNKVNGFSEIGFVQLSDEQTLDTFAQPILALRNQQITTKTILYLTFNHALNRRQKARDLLACSDIHETISGCDYYTKACFNRSLVQLAISSFCRGNIYETQQILDGLCGIYRNRGQNKEIIREFLAQSTSHDNKQIPRCLPYYLHMNIDLIEAIELISSMILELPYTFNEGGRISSKTVKKIFFDYERSHFLAEPLSYRDLIYSASNSLKLGNWKECYDKLLEIDIWTELGNPDEARSNLLSNIKESALRCYMMANRQCFRCVSLQGLADKFELELRTVRKLICKWINLKDRELAARITSDEYLIIPEKREQKQSDFQKICEKLFIKLEDVCNSNEQFYRQGVGKDEEDEADADTKEKKINLAITDKLKAILSRRAI